MIKHSPQCRGNLLTEYSGKTPMKHFLVARVFSSGGTYEEACFPPRPGSGRRSVHLRARRKRSRLLIKIFTTGCRPMGTGSTWIATATAGSHASKRVGDRTLTAVGFTQMQAGHGLPTKNGDGRPTIMDAGCARQNSGGCGFRDMNGPPRGCRGEKATSTSDGRHCHPKRPGNPRQGLVHRWT